MSFAYQVRDPADVRRIAELEEENAFLRRQLALEGDEDACARLGARWSLTPGEAALISALYFCFPRALAKGPLADLIPSSRDRQDIKFIDVLVCRIRKKIGAYCIETVWGRGNRLSAAFKSEIDCLLGGRFS